jgi:predicted histidine transporter YuiF (NhaC family)
MRKAIFMVVLAVAVIVSFAYWLVFHSGEMDIQEILMIAGMVLVVGFALFLAFRRLRDVKNQTPGEDEMSKKIMRRGAATSYYVSIYLWLVIMMFEDKIDLERSSLIGAGILGMAIIWVLSWIYHRYINRKYD